MRGHCNQITPLGVCRIDDCLIGVMVDGVDSVASDAGYFRRVGNNVKMPSGDCSRPFQVLLRGVRRNSNWLEGGDRERRRYMECCYLRILCLR